MRNTFPLYKISDLVLDLDAEDSKCVRQYDETVDGVLEEAAAKEARDQAPLRQRVAQFEQEYHRDDANFRTLSSEKFNPWHISDLDILSAALRDPSQTPSSDDGKRRHAPPVDMINLNKDQILETIYDWNGIPLQALESTSKTIPHMLRRQQLMRRKTPQPDEEKLVHAQLASCRSFEELKRLFARLSQTTEGSKLAASKGRLLSLACRQRARYGTAAEVRDAFVFLNDIFITFVRKGLEFDSILCRTGLMLAMQCSAYASAREYLAYGFPKSTYRPHHHEFAPNQLELAKCLYRALWSITGDRQQDRDFGVLLDPKERRIALYNLLTGHDLCGRYVEHSFDTHHHRYRDWKNYAVPYLHILAELGALRTLCHEFSGHVAGTGLREAKRWRDARTQQWAYRDKVPNPVVRVILRRNIPQATTDVFVAAVARLLKNIQSGRLLLPESSLASTTGNYEKDCRLDLITIYQSKPNFPETDADYNPPPDLYEITEKEKAAMAKEHSQPLAIDAALREEILDAFCLPVVEESVQALLSILFKNRLLEHDVSCPVEVRGLRKALSSNSS
ncbi:uncharacterized protein BCR38DRAFT_480720 [Pseudomassariella vexata]|uniref:Uncharacterized protein n=1 Tax=Pseudomassariella vexata TaxID=1141098 RepID=A0A1Y2EDZ7_9PEZI|nr:uncharacterized protein BCR38DRAFT_480720 [Pseudomassariella vexata]ORY69534.1 hypothetical protein BCR38DRAFT_480720 [Pseudomassariella vexata]